MNKNSKKLLIFCLCSLFILSSLNISVSLPNKIFLEKNNENLKEWTLMFFCSGDDSKRFGDGEGYWITNETILKIQDTFMKIPMFSRSKINALVLIDAATVVHGSFLPSKIPGLYKFNLIEEKDEANFGNYTVLRDFIIYSKSNFPAKRYLLYGFGHGAGWLGAFPDDYINDTEKKKDSLTMEEIRLALDESGGVDIILLANCIMGCMESAYELRNYTDVYIGSQEVSTSTIIPIISWYNCINVLKKYGKLSTYDISEKLVKNYKRYFRYRWSILQYLITKEDENMSYFDFSNVFTFSAVRTDKLSSLNLAIDSLSQKLIENISKYKLDIEEIRLKTEDFPHEVLTISEPTKGFLIDIYDFADLFSKKASDNNDIELYNLAEDVKKAIDDSIISELHQKDHPNAHGLSLFFTMNNNDSYNPEPYQDYNYNSYVNSILEFKNDNQWDDLIDIYLN